MNNQFDKTTSYTNPDRWLFADTIFECSHTDRQTDRETLRDRGTVITVLQDDWWFPRPVTSITYMHHRTHTYTALATRYTQRYVEIV